MKTINKSILTRFYFAELVLLWVFASSSVGADWKTPMQETSSWNPIYFIQGDDPAIYFQQTNSLPDTPFTPPGPRELSFSFFRCALNDHKVTKVHLEDPVSLFAVCPIPSARAFVTYSNIIQWFCNGQKRTISLEKNSYLYQLYLSPNGDRLSFIDHSFSESKTRSLLIYQFNQDKPIKIKLSNKIPRFIPYWFNENTILGWSKSSIFLLTINADFTRTQRSIVWNTPSERIIVVLALEDRIVAGLIDEKENKYRTLVISPDGKILKELSNTWLCDDGLSLDRYCCCIQDKIGLCVLDTKMLCTRLFIPNTEVNDQNDEDYNILGYDPKNDAVYVSINQPAPAVLEYRPGQPKRIILRATPEKPYFAEEK